MLEVYRQLPNGKIKFIISFNNLIELTYYINHDFDQYGFGYTFDQKTDQIPLLENYDVRNDYLDENGGRFCYVVFDIDAGKIITPEQISNCSDEIRYNSWINFTKRAIRRHRRKQAYHQYRSPKTTQERRWAVATREEENIPKIRSKRGATNLPSARDGVFAHNDKSWKTQSKRPHQWKYK